MKAISFTMRIANWNNAIVGIVDADGALVIEYMYDTGEWGMRLF